MEQIEMPFAVILAKAGIHSVIPSRRIDSCFRRNDIFILLDVKVKSFCKLH